MVPPPGAHDPNFHKIVSRDAAWSFGTSQRQSLNNAKNVPGAGTYDIHSRAVEGPAFAMGLKMDNMSSIGITVGRTK